MTRMIEFYNSQVEEFRKYLKGQILNNAQERKKKVEAFVDNDLKKISWSRELKYHVGRDIEHSLKSSLITYSMYRPFCKQWLYFDKNFNDVQGKID